MPKLCCNNRRRPMPTTRPAQQKWSKHHKLYPNTGCNINFKKRIHMCRKLKNRTIYVVTRLHNVSQYKWKISSNQIINWNGHASCLKFRASFTKNVTFFDPLSPRSKSKHIARDGIYSFLSVVVQLLQKNKHTISKMCQVLILN